MFPLTKQAYVVQISAPGYTHHRLTAGVYNTEQEAALDAQLLADTLHHRGSPWRVLIPKPVSIKRWEPVGRRMPDVFPVAGTEGGE